MGEAVVQPHDIRAEEEVLGAALTRECLGAIQAEIGLRPESFYRGDHQTIFAAMLALLREGKPVTELTVGNQLEKDAEQLERAGGRGRLALLAAGVANPTHVLHHAEIIREKARWRQRFDAATRIREAAVTEDADRFASAQESLADDPAHVRALYDADRQRDLLFELIEGRAKAEFFWPIERLNRLQSGGMRRGQLVVVSGYTNDGKSHFVGQILDHNRKLGRVCLYDNEMEVEEGAARRAARLGGVPYSALLDGSLSEEQTRTAMEFLNSGDHWPIVDISGWTVEEVCLHIRQYRWDLVAVDILHNFSFADERELSSSVAHLKAAARLARCVVVLVAHVNRSGVERGRRRRPVRSDLRWSGDIENLADVVCFVYREQDEHFEQTNEGSIYFDKCRGGRLGGAGVEFDPERLRFQAHFDRKDAKEPEPVQELFAA